MIDAKRPKPKAAKQTTTEILEQKYGAAYSVLMAVPEIKTILLNAIKGKTPQPAATVMREIMNSDWWRSNNATFRKNMMQMGSDPGEFQNGVAQAKVTVQKLAMADGLHLSDGQVDTLARNAYLYGFTNDQIAQAATGASVVIGETFSHGKDTGKANKKSFVSAPGSFADTQYSDDIRAYAKNMGVTLSAQDEANYRRRLAASNGSESDTIKNEILTMAKSIYEPFKNDLSLTSTLKDATAGYRRVASQLLEVPEDQLGFNDPLFNLGKGVITKDASGNMVKSTLSDFMDTVKRDPRWMNTQNAMDEYRQLANDMLSQMGFK